MKNALVIMLSTFGALAIGGAAEAATISTISLPTTSIGKARGEVLDGWTGAHTVNYSHELTMTNGGHGNINAGYGFEEEGVRNNPIMGTLTGTATNGGLLPNVGPLPNGPVSVFLAPLKGASAAIFTLSQPAHYLGFDFTPTTAGLNNLDTFNFYTDDGKTLIASISATEFGTGSFYANFTSNLPIDEFEIVAKGNSISNNIIGITDVEISAVPIPAALPLFGAAVAGLGAMGRRRKHRAAATA